MFISPIYESLETNIPTPIMRFSDLEFPPQTPLFPGHETVRNYIQGYASDVKHLIKFNSQVQDVSLLQSELGVKEQWAVRTEDIVSRKEHVYTYDAVCFYVYILNKT